MTTRTETATAADFEPYVAEARAEGKTDAEIVERWMREARPGIPVSGFGDWLEMEIDATTTAMWIFNGDTQLHVVEVRNRTVIAELDVRSDATGKTHDSLSSALAWLANQLAERCPVACLYSTPLDPPFAPMTDVRHCEAFTRGYVRDEELAANIRRRYGLILAEEPPTR